MLTYTPPASGWLSAPLRKVLNMSTRKIESAGSWRVVGSELTRLLPTARATSAAYFSERSLSYDLARSVELDAMKMDDIASAAMATTKMSTKTSAMPRRGLTPTWRGRAGRERELAAIMAAPYGLTVTEADG